MPSPFPGMDPYLEHPSSWPNLHHRLITAIAIFLAPHLRPKYRVVIEEAIYQTSGQDSILVGMPDVSVQYPQNVTDRAIATSTIASPQTQPISITLPMPETIRQGYLEIRDIARGEVITAIEVLSPANKRPGDGRKSYEKKRHKILASTTHLIEIDLLRMWEPMPTLNDDIKATYRILVSQSQRRPQADLYAFNLPDKIPLFPIPLRSEDREPIVNLQALLTEIYDQSSYDLVVDYCCEPVPALSPSDAAWVANLLHEKGLC